MRGSGDVRERLEAQGQEETEQRVKLRIFVKQRMRESGVNGRQLARMAHLSQPTITNWLRGDSELKGDSLLKLCGAVEALRPHGPTVAILQEAQLLALQTSAEVLAATG